MNRYVSPRSFWSCRHQVEHLGPDGHVQGGDGLVGDDEVGLHDEGPGDADALALTAGELVGEAAGELGQQAHVAEGLGHLLPLFRLGQVEPPA